MTRRRRVSLRRQLLAVLLALSVPLLVVGGVGGLLLRSSSAGHLESSLHVRVAADISVLQARVAALTAGLTVKELLSSEPAALMAVLQHTGDVERGFTELRREIPDGQRARVDAAYREWQGLVGAIALIPARLPQMAVDVRELSGTLNDLGPRILQVAHVLAEAAEENARALQADLDAEHTRQRGQLVQLVVLTVLGLAGAVVASRWLHRRITDPLVALQQAARRLGDGDLHDRVPEDRTPELGALGAAFNHMAERLRDSRALLSAREQRFRALVQHSSDLVAVLDRGGVVTYVTPSVRQVLGTADRAVVGTPLLDRVHPEDRVLVAAVLDAAVSSVGVTDSVACRLRVDGPDGGAAWCSAELVVNNLCDEPSVAGLVVTARDVTEQARLHRQLRHQAFHDELTGLANRALFSDRLGHALAGRDAASPAVLYADVDGLKAVNDTLGHAAGDVVLAAVAERLATRLRARDTAARVAGDEFAVLLEDVTAAEALEAARRLLAAVRAPLLVDGVEVFPHVSIGLAVADPADPVDAEQLLRQADAAMHQAKRHGADDVLVYDAAAEHALLARLELTADLHRAVQHGDLALHYQPTVDLVSGRITGVEALLRWHHPVRGPVSPAEFVPLAEETGLIGQLGLWVLRTACTQVRAWQLAAPDRPLHLNVNLSGRQLEQAGVVEDVATVLAETGLDAGSLTLELTESVLLDRSDEVLGRLHALRALGLSLAIDDFGTGYSSLSYLQRLPVDVLKIDKSFVDALTEAGDSGTGDALAATIVRLAQTLGLRSVAEGIEQPGQADALRLLGCEVGQGYLFARPLAPAALQALLAADRPLTPVVPAA